MAEIYELNVEIRNSTGKGANRRLRRENNKIPAVIYGGEKKPTSITLDHNIFIRALEKEGFYSHILTLKVDGKAEKVVLKDLHRHPYKPKILHADFQRVSAKTKLTMHIPLHFIGEEIAPGVKDQAGIISHHLTEVEVRCLPADLPEFIEVDISNLNIDDTIHLTQLNIPKGVEIVALIQGKEFDQPVISIHKPHIAPELLEEEVASEEVEEEAAPGEPGEETPEEPKE